GDEREPDIWRRRRHQRVADADDHHAGPLRPIRLPDELLVWQVWRVGHVGQVGQVGKEGGGLTTVALFVLRKNLPLADGGAHPGMDAALKLISRLRCERVQAATRWYRRGVKLRRVEALGCRIRVSGEI